MFRFLVALTFLFLIGIGLTYGVPTTSPTTSKINNLVEQLSSEDSRKRESAVHDLDTIGEPALEALKKAAKGTNKEATKLAEQLIRKIESRVANKKRFEATLIELKFKDTPVDTAVKELAKQSGYQILISGKKANLAEKRVTLDTGKVPFWTALEKLCEAADLKEIDSLSNPTTLPAPANGQLRPIIRVAPVQGVPLPPMEQEDKLPAKDEKPKEEKKKEEKPKEDKPKESKSTIPVEKSDKPKVEKKAKEEIQIVEGVPPKDGKAQPIVEKAQVQIVQGRQLQLTPVQITTPTPTGLIRLEQGKRDSSPSHVEGAIRIRALPNLSPANRGQMIGDDEIAFLLQAQSEPKLNIVRVQSVKIEKAIDNNDQKLSFVAPPTPETVTKVEPAIAPVPQPNPNGVPIPVGVNTSARVAPYLALRDNPFPIRLKKGDKESKSIKELVGIVTITCRSTPEELVVVENVLKAKPETVNGQANTSLKVEEIKKEEDGSYSVKVEFSFPLQVVAPTRQVIPRQPVPVNGQGAVPKQGLRLTNNLGIELLDSEGKGYQFGGSEQLPVYKNTDGNQTGTVTLTYRPSNKDQKEPSKLVFRGTQLIDLEVPFTLKDIPLKK